MRGTGMAWRRPSLVSPSRRRRPSAGWGAWLAAIVLLALIVTLVVTRAGDDDDSAGEGRAAQRAQLLVFFEALDPITKDGGRVVQEGLKRSVTDLHQSKLPDAELLATAEADQAEMERVRDQLAALKAPSFLRATKTLYDHALRDYVVTARVLVAAARATGDERAALVRLAIDMGEETDDFYEQAEDALARARARLGLPPEEEPPG